MSRAADFAAQVQATRKFTFETQMVEGNGRAKIQIRHPQSAVRTLTFAQASAAWIARHGKRFSRGEGLYEPGLLVALLALRNMRTPGGRPVLYDVGVHHGYVALTATALGGFSQVIGFDMNPRVLEFARRSVALNPKISTRIDLVQAIIADRTEMAVPCMYSGLALRIRPTDEERKALEAEEFREAEIDMLSLDDFVTHGGAAPSIVKIDVEGSVSTVLDGARQVIATHRPIFLIEGDGAQVANYNGVQMIEICHWMADQGYEIVALEHRHWAFNPILLSEDRDAWPDEDVLKTRLMVFLPMD